MERAGRKQSRPLVPLLVRAWARQFQDKLVLAGIPVGLKYKTPASKVNIGLGPRVGIQCQPNLSRLPYQGHSYSLGQKFFAYNLIRRINPP
jgi:hypothetical protein